jgi:hypothetical protein
MTDEGTYAIMTPTPDESTPDGSISDGSGSGWFSKYWRWALVILILIIVIVVSVVAATSGSRASAPTPNAPEVLPNGWTPGGRDELFVFIKQNVHVGDDCARTVMTIVMNKVTETDYKANKMSVVSDVVRTKVPCIGTKGNWTDTTLKGYLTSLLSRTGNDALVSYPLATGCATCVAKQVMQNYSPDDFILKTMSPSPDFLSYIIKPDPNCRAFCMK